MFPDIVCAHMLTFYLPWFPAFYPAFDLAFYPGSWHVALDEELWARFVYLCPHCAAQKKMYTGFTHSITHAKNMTKKTDHRFATSSGWLFCVGVAIFVTIALSVTPCTSSESVHDAPPAGSDQPTRLGAVQTVYLWEKDIVFKHAKHPVTTCFHTCQKCFAFLHIGLAPNWSVGAGAYAHSITRTVLWMCSQGFWMREALWRSLEGRKLRGKFAAERHSSSGKSKIRRRRSVVDCRDSTPRQCSCPVRFRSTLLTSCRQDRISLQRVQAGLQYSAGMFHAFALCRSVFKQYKVRTGCCELEQQKVVHAIFVCAGLCPVWRGHCCGEFSKCLLRVQQNSSKVALYHTLPSENDPFHSAGTFSQMSSMALLEK